MFDNFIPDKWYKSDDFSGIIVGLLFGLLQILVYKLTGG